MSETKSIHLLISWCKSYRVFFWLTIAILVIIVLLSSMLPLMVKLLLDRMLTHQDQEVAMMMSMLFGLIAMRVVASYSADFVLNWIAGKLSTDLQTRLLEKALVRPVQHFEQHDLRKFYIDGITNISKIVDLGTRVFWGQAKDILICIGLVATMFYINRDAAILGVFLILITVLIVQIINKEPNHPDSYSLAITKSLDLFQQIMEHVRSIKIDRSLSQEKNNFYQLLEKQRVASMKPIVGHFISQLLAIIIFSLIFIAVFYYLLHQYYLYKLTLSEIIAMIVTFGLLAPSLIRFLNRISVIGAGRIALQQLDEFLSLEKDLHRKRVMVGAIQGAIGLENFKLQSSSPLVTPFSLTIQPKECVVLTAADPKMLKSLLDCVLQFNQPHTGRITLDGIDITTLDIEEIGTKVAWISPDIPLLDDTLAANIAYGTMQCATEAQLTAVARVSHVADFARAMPYGLQTRINNEELLPDKAFKQCILLARALLKNPAIVIIDESSAEFILDNEKVSHTLDILMEKRTSIIISARQPKIRKVHKIICLDR